ncbi:MAG TPA: SDR family oxidoreductase [Frankiaceae bacterium]|nr:SDR family oxidoreductase [Frankiaceae bacterium]
MSPTAALVTGGGSGIGLATVRQLAAAGRKVVIADRDELAGKQAAADVSGRFVATDVSDQRAVQALFDTAEQEVGPIGLVVLNAGVTTGETPIEDLCLDKYRTVVGVNVDGVVFGIRAALPALRRSGGGAIVVTASLSGLTPYPDDPIYAMTKHAVVGLVRSLATPLGKQGVTINCVCPGFVSTPLIDDYRAKFEAAGLPLLSAEVVAEAVLAAADSGDSGQAWVCQPGRAPEPYRFRGVPGPAAQGDTAP